MRIFHWSLVSAFFIAYFTEDELLDAHVYAGYVVTGLLAFRLIWGVVGCRYARFSSFVKHPNEVWAYMKSIVKQHPKHYLGHNPAGGAMKNSQGAIVMLAILRRSRGFMRKIR